jgi:subtilisin family serine protease
MNSTRLAAVLLAAFLPLAFLLAEAPRERQALLERLNVPAWHQAGQRGKGVKVAVLDTGWQGYRDHLGKSLPRSVVARSFRPDGQLEARASQHGILCGEVLHAIAPEAELLVANWESDQPATFLDAVRWARQQGARVISCSVIMPTWSDNEGHGDAHGELAKLLGDEALLFAAAGNTAERHWHGPFAGDAEQRHQWKPGVCDNRLVPWEQERVCVEMVWRGDARYQVEVLDGLTGKLVTLGLDSRDGEHAWAAARFVPETGRSYTVRVRKVHGSAGRFHLVALGATLEQTNPQGSISFPADGPEAIAVGAVSLDDQRQSYSACGLAEGLRKPDLVAAVPFPSAVRDRPFTGTSAAAPQAAALAALLWGRHPDWPASRVRETLTKAARRLTREDHDPATGYGQARLP